VNPTLAATLRALADALEHAPAANDVPPFYSTCPSWLERRAWNRALREIPTFKVGRRVLVKPADLHAWIERHAEAPSAKPAADVLDYESFARAARKSA
jgi:hypothetical protein